MSKIMKVCRGDEVEKATREGWMLRSCITGTVIHEIQETVSQFVPGHNDQYGVWQYDKFIQDIIPRQMVGTLTSFLMELDEESSLKRLTDAKNAAVESETQVKHELKLVKALVEDQATAMVLKDSAIKTYTSIVERLTQTQKQALVMEADLAKLRKAIGERQFNEILAVEPKV